MLFTRWFLTFCKKHSYLCLLTSWKIEKFILLFFVFMSIHFEYKHPPDLALLYYMSWMIQQSIPIIYLLKKINIGWAVFWLHLIMLLGEMFVLTVQSSRFSHYCSEFPAVNMWILKHNNLNIIKWMAETRMRRVHSFYNMKIVVFQYEHVDSRKLWKILRKATWLHCWYESSSLIHD